MATFLVLQQELADQLNLDQTVSTVSTQLQRWINLAVQDICGRHDWSFLEEREIIQTVADKNAGTVSVNSAGTIVTGVNTAFASTDVRSYINFQGSSDWYEVTAYSSPTSITIGQAYNGASNLSGGTYTLRKVYNSLSTSADRIFSVRQMNTPVRLSNVGPSIFDTIIPNPSATGDPIFYYAWRLDPAVASASAKQWQIVFYPIPSTALNIEIRTYKIPTDMSVNGDISQIPVKWHNAILEGARYLGQLYINDLSWRQTKLMYEATLRRMITEDGQDRDHHTVFQAADRSAQQTRFVRFPDNYENGQQ